MRVSVVVPTYNEVENIDVLLVELQDVLKYFMYEILVVDDMSPDGTGRAVLTLRKGDKRIQLVSKPVREGIGAALRYGYDRAQYDVIVSLDADLSFKTDDVLQLLERIDAGADLVVGNRHSGGGSYETRKIGTQIKGIVSHVGNWFFTKYLGVPVHDLSANFRAIRKSTWHELHAQEKGNVLLAEMIVLAHRRGYRVREVDVSFSERKAGVSKLRLFRELPLFVRNIMKIHRQERQK